MRMIELDDYSLQNSKFGGYSRNICITCTYGSNRQAIRESNHVVTNQKSENHENQPIVGSRGSQKRPKVTPIVMFI